MVQFCFSVFCLTEIALDCRFGVSGGVLGSHGVQVLCQSAQIPPQQHLQLFLVGFWNILQLWFIPEFSVQVIVQLLNCRQDLLLHQLDIAVFRLVESAEHFAYEWNYLYESLFQGHVHDHVYVHIERQYVKQTCKLLCTYDYVNQEKTIRLNASIHEVSCSVACLSYLGELYKYPPTLFCETREGVGGLPICIHTYLSFSVPVKIL